MNDRYVTVGKANYSATAEAQNDLMMLTIQSSTFKQLLARNEAFRDIVGRLPKNFEQRELVALSCERITDEDYLPIRYAAIFPRIVSPEPQAASHRRG
jgi:hypothetical protein